MGRHCILTDLTEEVIEQYSGNEVNCGARQSESMPPFK